jgi:Flp pilus assembly protein TadG
MTSAKRRIQRPRSDRGSAAVELALVLPLLLLLVFGTIDFGRMIAWKITITQAAREGVRVWALGNGTATVPSAGDVQTAVSSAACASSTCAATAAETSCTDGQPTTVTVSYPFTFVTPVGALARLLPGVPVSGDAVTLTSQAVMQCSR